jgi:hypothetical protein
MASAQAITQTAQILPLGGNSCALLPISAITAHVVDGALHSFDITVGNASYVAVLAQVGGETLPFNYVTRYNHGGGMLRHHIDVNTTPTRGALPVSLTLLSSPPGSPTCLSVISFSVGSSGQILAPGMSSGAMPPVTSKPTGGTGATTGSGSTGGKTSGGKGTTTTKPTTTAPTTTVATPTDGGLFARLQSLCAGNGALQLWFLLLAIYIVIASLTALAKPPLAQKATWVPAAAILAPLVLLLGFWLFAPTCRAAGWIPAVSVIIAIAALPKTPAVVNKTAAKTDSKAK